MHYPFERSNLPDPTFVVHLQYMTCIHNTITLYLQSYDTLSIYIYTGHGLLSSHFFQDDVVDHHR
jgi:hypothetical protein